VSEAKPKKSGVLALLALMVMVTIAANAWKSSLKMKQVKVEGNRIVATNEIVQLMQAPFGTLLYKADLTSIQRNVMSHYYIKDAVVERNLPNTIHVTVKERVPIAIINRSEPLYLDDEGVVLPRSVSKKLFDLPVISGITTTEQLTLGSHVTQPDVLEALQLLAVVKVVNRPLSYNISEIQVRNGGDIVLFAAEGGVPIIFGRGELASKIARLEVFWNDVARVRGPQNLQYVDLRYQDQVVARWMNEQAPAKTM
jgi:cell division protein FtsQ